MIKTHKKIRYIARFLRDWYYMGAMLSASLVVWFFLIGVLTLFAIVIINKTVFH